MSSSPPPLDATAVLLADSLALLNIDGEHDPSTTTAKDPAATITALRAHCAQLRTALIDQHSQLATVRVQLVAERTKTACLAEQLDDSESLLQVRSYELAQHRRQYGSLESKLAATNERCIELEANSVADAALVAEAQMAAKAAQRKLTELKRQGGNVAAARPRRERSDSLKESQQLINKLHAHRRAAFAKLKRAEHELHQQRGLAVEWERRWQRVKRDAETAKCSSGVLEKQLAACKERLLRLTSRRAVEVVVPPPPVAIVDEAATADGEPAQRKQQPPNGDGGELVPNRMDVVVLPPVAIEETEAAAVVGEPAQQQKPPIGDDGESAPVSLNAVGDVGDIASDYVIVYGPHAEDTASSPGANDVDAAEVLDAPAATATAAPDAL